MKNQKGITLIALVITIIVMLILVAVSVTVALNGGLFRTAKQAADETAVEKDKEILLLDGQIEVGGKIYASHQDYLDNNYIVEWTETTKPDGWSNNVKAMKFGTDIIPLPTGFEISTEKTEDEVSEGLVIKDSNNNEFVWIPVEDIEPVSDEEPFINPYNYSSTYSEPTTVSNDTQSNLDKYYGTKTDGTTPYYTLETDFVYSDHYEEMVASVNKYDGFYVGRYETTIDDEGNIGSKNNTTVLIARSILKEGENTNDSNNPFYYRWWGLYYAQRNNTNVVGNGSIVQSNMIWGQQWDAMMDFLGEEQANSKISGSQSQVLKSGEATYDDGLKDVINNIYDLRKNGYDWTAEVHSAGYRVLRGGNFITNVPAFRRVVDGPVFASSRNYASRLALYIK